VRDGSGCSKREEATGCPSKNSYTNQNGFGCCSKREEAAGCPSKNSYTNQNGLIVNKRKRNPTQTLLPQDDNNIKSFHLSSTANKVMLKCLCNTILLPFVVVLEAFLDAVALFH